MDVVSKPGPKNLITDVTGLLVGNSQVDFFKTGTTVLVGDKPFMASVHVMGGAPGTKETDLLAPDKTVDQIDALVLSGGSAFGLDACSGVMDGLREMGRGFPVGPMRVPIVPGAIIFDLINGGNKDWGQNPYRALGAAAFAAAGQEFALGSAGAGTGATTGNYKGGLGSASLVLESGMTVGALVAANPFGTVAGPQGHFHAASHEIAGEFGGLGVDAAFNPLAGPHSAKMDGFNPRGNTTIAIVATDAALTKAQALRMATAAQDGLARAIWPAHTPVDGDLVFAAATGARALQDETADLLRLGHAAAICLARAVARGIYHATAAKGDVLPCWINR